MTRSDARAHGPRAPRPERCARCNAAFECGVDTGDCWCASLAPLGALPEGLPPRCLCARCLSELTQSYSGDCARRGADEAGPAC